MKLKPIKIGKLNIECPLFLAPMAGITDQPFRMLAKKYGAGVVVSEMVSARACVYKNKKTMSLMDINSKEHPVGIQLFSSESEDIITGAKMAAECGADFIDLNMGCPAPKVMKSGGGFALMQKPGRLKGYFDRIVRSCGLPVTIKYRIGTEKTRNYMEIGRIAYESGISAVVLHCRVKEARHKGEPDYSVVSELAGSIGIPVIANGGIDTAKKAYNVYKSTGCAGLMIGQAAIGRPGIFSEIREYFYDGGSVRKTDGEFALDYFEELLIASHKYYKNAGSLLRLRKLLPCFNRDLHGSAAFRKKYNSEKDFNVLLKMVRSEISRHKASIRMQKKAHFPK